MKYDLFSDATTEQVKVQQTHSKKGQGVTPKRTSNINRDEVDGWLPTLEEVSFPPLGDEVIAEVVCHKRAAAGKLER